MDGLDLHEYEPPPPRRRQASMLIGLLAAAIVLGLGFAAAETSKSSFCLGCHTAQRFSRAARAGSHAETTCLDCHRDRGPLGGVGFRLRMIGYASLNKVYLRRHRPVVATDASAACANCHGSALKRTVRGRAGLRISHKEPVKAGIGCARCHKDAGHPSNTAALVPAHDYCFACHKAGSGERCSFCHTKDISSATSETIDAYSPAQIKSLEACDNCHTTASCGGCHQGNVPRYLNY